jgi:hypothetical protein
MMQTKMSSFKQFSLTSMINNNNDGAHSMVTSYVAQSLFDLTAEMKLGSDGNLVESNMDQSNINHLLSSSTAHDYYSKILQETFCSRVSSETSIFDMDFSIPLPKDQQRMPMGSFDDGSELGDYMDIDDNLSIISEGNDSTQWVQAEKHHVALGACFSDQLPTLPTTTSLHSPNDDEQYHVPLKMTTGSQLQRIESTLNDVQCRLHECMNKSLVTQGALQEWDRLNELPASHARTMVNTARSRKQLQEGVILKKWDGSPLVATTGDMMCT